MSPRHRHGAPGPPCGLPPHPTPDPAPVALLTPGCPWTWIWGGCYPPGVRAPTGTPSLYQRTLCCFPQKLTGLFPQLQVEGPESAVPSAEGPLGAATVMCPQAPGWPPALAECLPHLRAGAPVASGCWVKSKQIRLFGQDSGFGPGWQAHREPSGGLPGRPGVEVVGSRVFALRRGPGGGGHQGRVSDPTAPEPGGDEHIRVRGSRWGVSNSSRTQTGQRVRSTHLLLSVTWGHVVGTALPAAAGAFLLRAYTGRSSHRGTDPVVGAPPSGPRHLPRSPLPNSIPFG